MISLAVIGTVRASSGLHKDSAPTSQYIHAVLMLIAWTVLYPAGVLFARFTRHKQSVKMGMPYWFRWHVIFQVSGSVFLLTGFVLALLMPKQDGHFSGVHNKVGLAVVIATVLQPLNALVRPHPKPETLKRKIWEHVHKGLGYGAAMMSIAAVIIGMRWTIKPEVPMPFVMLYLGIIGCLSVLFVVLEMDRRKKHHALAAADPTNAAGVTKVHRS